LRGLLVSVPCTGRLCCMCPLELALSLGG